MDLQEEVIKLNIEQMQLRKDYPNLFNILELAQMDNRKYIDDYFYPHFSIGRNDVIYTKLIFLDITIDKFLNQKSKEYKNIIDPEEIPVLFVDMINDFLKRKKIKDFQKADKSKQLNSLRKFLKTRFENWLIRESEIRQGVKVKQINNVKYKVFNPVDIISIDEIAQRKLEKYYCTYDNYNLDNLPIDNEQFTKAATNRLDIEAYKVEYGHIPSEEQLKEYIIKLDKEEVLPEEELDIIDEYNYKYRDVLLNNQREKIDTVLKELIINPSLIDELLNIDTGELNKHKLGAILFPKSFAKDNSGQVMQEVNNLLKTIQKRIGKYFKQDKKAIKYSNSKLLKLLTKEDSFNLINGLVTEKELKQKYYFDSTANEYGYVSYPCDVFEPTIDNDFDLELNLDGLKYKKYKLNKTIRLTIGEQKKKLYIIHDEFEKIKKNFKNSSKNRKKVI